MNDQTLRQNQSAGLLLQRQVEPMPLFAPRPQMTNLAMDEDETDLPFSPNPIQLLLRSLFHITKMPIREMQVLDSHQGAGLVFFLPHGFISYREVDNTKPTLEELMAEILERLENVEDAQQAILGRLRVIQQQAAAHQRAQAARQAASRPAVVSLDPVLPVSVKDLGPRYNAVLRQLAVELVYWQPEFALQEHQTWAERAIKLLQQADEMLMQNKILRQGETDFMRHYLDLFTANPALWQPAS